MNLKKRFLVVLVFLLLASLPSIAQPLKQKRKKIATPAPATKTERADLMERAELLELLQRAQHVAEQAQEEARRAREQSADLQQRLTQNTEELSQLRQTILAFGQQLATLQKDAPTKTALTPEVAPPESASPAQPSAAALVQAKLDSLQEQVEVNTAQIKEHAQTKVETDSKFRVKLHGLILANAFLNTNDSSLNDVPLFAPLPSLSPRRNNVGASLRQTRLGFTFEGPRLSQSLGNARLSAETEFDFWGGETSEVLGSLRILTASARLDWEHTSLIIGQRQPLVSPRNPTSLAAAWFAPLTAAGNLWQWRPQLMVEHRVRADESTEWQLQGGVLMPFGETLQGEVIEGGLGYEARVGWSRTLASEQKLEFGAGYYFHRRPFSLGRHVDSHALTGDWQIPLLKNLLLSGEAFAGRAVNLGEAAGFRNDRLYGTNGQLSNLATTIRGVYSTGGWAQLNYKAHPALDFNFAYGQDDPRNRDFFAQQFALSPRLKNQAAFANFIWTLRQNFLISLEYRRLWTDYQNSRQRAGHYNLAFGYIF